MLIFLSHQNLTVKTTDGRLLSQCFEERLSQETGEKCIVLDWCAGVFRTDGNQDSLVLNDVTWDSMNCPGCDQTEQLRRDADFAERQLKRELRRIRALKKLLTFAVLGSIVIQILTTTVTV